MALFCAYLRDCILSKRDIGRQYKLTLTEHLESPKEVSVPYSVTLLCQRISRHFLLTAPNSGSVTKPLALGPTTGFSDARLDR